MCSASEDFEAIVSSTITFSPAQTSVVVTVTIVDDGVLEDVELFTVEVVATGGQERVDVGSAATIFVYDDDCEYIFVLTFQLLLSMCLSSCENKTLVRCV